MHTAILIIPFLLGIMLLPEGQAAAEQVTAEELFEMPFAELLGVKIRSVSFFDTVAM